MAVQALISHTCPESVHSCHILILHRDECWQVKQEQYRYRPVELITMGIIYEYHIHETWDSILVRFESGVQI